MASGAPGGLFTPSLAAGALAGAALGELWLQVHPGGEIGLFALLGAGAMLAASTQGPVSSLVLMMELTGQARAFALPMLTAIVIATATARLIEWRSIYEARLTDEEVAERLRAREPRGSERSSALLHPRVANLLIRALHRRPGDAESGFLLAGIVRVGGVCVVECFAKNVLGALREMRADRRGQIGVHVIGHGRLVRVSGMSPARRMRPTRARRLTR